MNSTGAVLVTGAGGFIGSHLTEALVRRGHRVRAFVRYNSRGRRGWLDAVPKDAQDAIEFVAGDLKDGHAVRMAVRGCERVYHLGALIAIPYSYQHPLDFVQTNVMGTANVLNAARDEAGLERLVHTSTSECYGTAQVVPMSETHPLQAQSPYAASKIAADKLAESYHRSFELPVVTVRPFNAFGPRQSARAIIPAIVSQVLAGGTVSVGNTTPTRDFTFVSDTVAGFLAAGDSAAAVGRVVNLGTQEERSIQELFDTICGILGRSPQLEVRADRQRPQASEVERLCADATLARTLLGWRPMKTFTEGLTETIQWIREHGSEFRPGTYHV